MKLKQTTQIIDHHLRYNSSFKSMENMSKIINSTPNNPVKVPCTKYKIKQLVPPVIHSEYHIQCPGCSNYLPSRISHTNCDTCKIDLKASCCNYFMYIPFIQQLKRSIDENFDEIITYASTVAQSDIFDIQNGEKFKQVQKLYPNSIVLPVVVNTDGAQVFRSNRKSLWLIQVCQAYLKPSKRYLPQNILVVAAHFDSKKPKMTDFFYPFLKEVKEINEKYEISLTRNNEKYTFTLFIICSCDLPAKADLQGFVGHSGRYGCGYCLHPGISIKPDKNTRAKIRFTKGKNEYEERTHANTIASYERLQCEPIFGVKRMSCMIALHDFDLIHSFAIDSMHCVHLGVMRKMLSLWLDIKNKSHPYYINKKNQTYLSSRLVSIKPISEIIRKPRSIFCKGDFKANELRNLLLYYLYFALSGLLQFKYVNHFRLLSRAVYTLSKQNLTHNEIENAHKELVEFVNTFEELYGPSNVTMNLHLLKHLAKSVVNLGPLWATSVYAFETNNGVVIKSNTSTKDILHQLSYKYTMRKTIRMSEQAIDEVGLHGKGTTKITSTEKTLLEKEGIQVQNTNIVNIYKSVVVRGIKYTSQKSKEISCIDFFVLLKNGSIALINFYILINLNLKALITLVEIDEKVGHFIRIIRTPEQRMISLNDIHCKLLYMKFGSNEYVTVIANKFEKT